MNARGYDFRLAAALGRLQMLTEDARQRLTLQHGAVWLRQAAPLGRARWRWAEHELEAGLQHVLPAQWRWRVWLNSLDSRLTVHLLGPGGLRLEHRSFIGSASRPEVLQTLEEAGAKMASRARARADAADPTPMLGTYRADRAPAAAPFALSIPEDVTVKLSLPRVGIVMEVAVFLDGVPMPLGVSAVNPSGPTLRDWADAVERLVIGLIAEYDAHSPAHCARSAQLARQMRQELASREQLR